MASRKYFKLAKRHVPTRRGKEMYHIYSLNVPTEIAEKVPEGVLFDFQVIAGSFVFTPVTVEKKVVKEVIATPIKLEL
jgi:hypothetical protein